MREEDKDLQRGYVDLVQLWLGLGDQIWQVLERSQRGSRWLPLVEELELLLEKLRRRLQPLEEYYGSDSHERQ